MKKHKLSSKTMPVFLLFLFLLSFAFDSANAQSRGSIITPGSSSLSPNTNISYWLSPSGRFAFGFYQYQNGYSVGIWFHNIQQRTVVWTANRDAPPFPSDVSLLLTIQGRLIVRSNQGQEDIPIAADNLANASSASMLDTGNFVVYNSRSEIIWQSFDFPTDTILPGQRLVAPNQLVSDVSDTNHTRGKFVLLMQPDGNLVQYSADYIQTGTGYWTSVTNTAGNGVSLNLDSNGLLYLRNATGFYLKGLNIITNVNASSKPIYLARIDADGIFRLYSHSSNRSDDWLSEWSSLGDRCAPLGLCGENSYCALMDGEPVCQCPPHFDYIDGEQKTLGCRKNYSFEGCTEKKDATFDFFELISITWKDDAYSSFSSATKNSCRAECFRDCNCEAALFNDQTCKMFKLPLRVGKREINSQTITLLKIGAEVAGTRTGKRKVRMDILIISIVMGACLTLAFLVVAAIGVCKYRSHVREIERMLRSVNNQVAEDVTLKSFTFEELKDATNNFADEIGKGAYGTVFRGVISNGERQVAIKRLDKVVAEGERDFRNEMKAIGKTHHKNLVQLLGYCYDGTNRILVYEYMGKGSLEKFLFKSESKVNWEKRVEIALNIARGIRYLHEECETPIIHCDIKPENILMDDGGCAKIADFGLAKLLTPNQTGTHTEIIRGTTGYIAPEWRRNLPITVKADVYSFGIMLFEIICYRRSVKRDVPENEQLLTFWIYDCFKANEVEKLVQNEEVEKSKLERMVKVGLLCTQDEAPSRPSMKTVILMLEGTVNIPDPPLPGTSVTSGSPCPPSSVATCFF